MFIDALYNIRTHATAINTHIMYMLLGLSKYL